MWGAYWTGSFTEMVSRAGALETQGFKWNRDWDRVSPGKFMKIRKDKKDVCRLLIREIKGNSSQAR